MLVIVNNKDDTAQMGFTKAAEQPLQSFDLITHLPLFVYNKDIHKDRTKNIIREIQATKKGGGNVMFSQDMTFSSSSLINNHYNLHSPLQKKFQLGGPNVLRGFPQHTNLSDDHLLASRFGFKFPLIVNDAIKIFIVSAIPLALFSLGGVLYKYKISKNLKISIFYQFLFSVYNYYSFSSF